MNFEKVQKSNKWALGRITVEFIKNAGEVDEDGLSLERRIVKNVELEEILEFGDHESKDDKQKLKQLRQDKKALQDEIKALQDEIKARNAKIKAFKEKKKK